VGTRIAVRAAVGVAAATVMVASLAAAASASHQVEKVPYRMDASNQAGWWSPVEEYGGNLYVAYNAWGGPGPTNGGANDTHTVYVAKQTATGEWTRGCLRVSPGGSCVVYTDDVGHNQPSIAIDGDGYIHAFVSMHNNNWRYYRSEQPGDVTTMVNRSAEMPDQNQRYTYPNLTRAEDGDVYLIIRAYPDWPGPGHGRLYRWDNSTNQWERSATFAAQDGWVVYPDDIDVANGKVHIAWEWAYRGASGIRHLGSYMSFDPATGAFRNAAGSAVSVPATTSSAVVYRALGGHDDLNCRSASSCPGVQSAKMVIDPVTGRPMVAYRYRSNHDYPFRVWSAEWTGNGWANSLVYRGSYDTHAALDISAYAGGVRVYYAKKGTLHPNQAHVATRQAGGSWAEHALLSGIRVDRLAIEQSGSTDYLYLAATGEQELHFGSYGW
jgi:hypothetical protein